MDKKYEYAFVVTAKQKNNCNKFLTYYIALFYKSYDSAKIMSSTLKSKFA